MHAHALKSVSQLLALATLISFPISIAAQVSAAGKGPSSEPFTQSKWDFFAGYSYLSPHDTVNIPKAGGGTFPASYNNVNVGGLFSFTRFFNPYLGAQIEVGEHEWGGQYPTTGTNGIHGNDDGFMTYSGGLVLRYPGSAHFTPFVHVVAGLAYVNGPYYNANTWGPQAGAGGGLDLQTSWFHHRLAYRLIQADYEYIHENFGTGTTVGSEGGIADINAYRLSTGFVIHGKPLAPPPSVSLACVASPSAVFPGDPITISAVAGELNPKLNAIYAWSGSGVTGNGTSATVATASLAPGTYPVNVTVKQGKPGKEGLKPWDTASCSASFTVKPFDPPTISCSANPTTILPSGTSTISSVAVSPQNRPLTYSYSASGGSVSGSGPTAVFSSAGAPTGAVGITCSVSDDKGHSATANTSVNVEAPPPPPQPHVQALCSISFSTDARRPTRVDNEAKACLDQVALNLKQQSDARVVIVGESNAQEKADTAKKQALAAKRKHVVVEQYAEQRAVNAKDYLVTDQGIDASRISLVTGAADSQTGENFLVPQGASFSSDVSGTTPVDESTLKPESRKPLPVRRRPAKK